MVERLALVAWRFRGRQLDTLYPGATAEEHDFAHQSEETRNNVCQEMRALLAELRDHPTPEMFVQGVGLKLAVWQAMIDRALS